MNDFLAILLQTLLLLALSPLISGCIRNWKAKLQNRRGPRIWQPYFDLVKFLRKDMVISEHASWIFRAMPYVLFTSTLLAGLMMPLVNVSAPLSLFGGVLAFVGLLALGRFFLALGGLDPASAFGGMGSSREMTIAAIAEPALNQPQPNVTCSPGTDRAIAEPCARAGLRRTVHRPAGRNGPPPRR
jgi:formate hydrogenlyase subunit 4